MENALSGHQRFRCKLKRLKSNSYSSLESEQSQPTLRTIASLEKAGVAYCYIVGIERAIHCNPSMYTKRPGSMSSLSHAGLYFPFISLPFNFEFHFASSATFAVKYASRSNFGSLGSDMTAQLSLTSQYSFHLPSSSK